MNKIQNLTQKECGIYCQETLLTVNDHWENGEIMASHAKYHAAVANIILSTEELAKAMLLYMDSQGFKFRTIAGIDAFFRNHELRYIISFFVLVMGNLGKDIISLIERLRNGDLNTEKLENMLEESKASDKLPKGLNFYVRKKFILFNRDLDWFSAIPVVRQNSMYSEYLGSFKSPLMIKKSDYDLVKEKLGLVRWVGLSLCERNYQKEFTDSWKDVAERLDKMQFYDIMGEILKQVKNSRIGAFDYLKQEMELLRE